MRKTSSGVLLDQEVQQKSRPKASPTPDRSRAERRGKVGTASAVALVLLFSAALSFFQGDALFGSALDTAMSPHTAVAASPAATAATATARTTTTPAPTQAPAPASPNAAPVSVWLPKSGTRYHASPTCSGMKSPSESTAEEASALGYLPCPRCVTPGEAMAIPTATPDADASATVWLPKSGKRYHANPACSGMKAPTESTASEAVANGYLPCPKCRPPELYHP